MQAGSNRNGSSSKNLEQVSICDGKYMVFNGKGKIQQLVIDTWLKIWDFFSADDAEFQRAYTTDFEFYKRENEIEIYIAVK